jgi:hypothetical protein
MLEEYTTTIETLSTAVPANTAGLTDRPGTTQTALLSRAQDTAALVQAAALRANADLSQAMQAIFNLDVNWLRAEFDRHYPQEFRVYNAIKNPSGCWFQSYQDNHRGGPYMQKNWSATPVPPSANPNHPWTIRHGGRVIGSQPR